MRGTRPRSRSRFWAAIATIAFGLTLAGFLTIDIDGPTIILAIFAPFVGVVAGTVAVVSARRSRESMVWPVGSLLLNLFPAGFWLLVILVATGD
jgi:hypothetical protein